MPIERPDAAPIKSLFDIKHRGGAEQQKSFEESIKGANYSNNTPSGDAPTWVMNASEDASYFLGGAGAKSEGTNGNDAVTLGTGSNPYHGKQFDNKYNGKDGDDIINVMSDANAKVRGGSGNDTIKGGDIGNRLSGNKGNDTITGGKGVDVILGGRGNDHLEGGEGRDKVKGGSGNDYLDGGAGSDRLKGGRGDDEIYSGAGDDKVKGGKGNDTITLDGIGKKDVSGGKGDDTINVMPGVSGEISGGKGTDVVNLNLKAIQDANPDHVKISRDGNDTRIAYQFEGKWYALDIKGVETVNIV